MAALCASLKSMLIPPQAGLRFCACPAIARFSSDGGSAHALPLDITYYF